MKIFLLTITALLGLAACNKILDTKPQDFASPAQYYSTESQLNDALAGVYSTLGSSAFYGDNYLYLLTTGNDETWYRVTPTPNIPLYTFDANDVQIARLWAALYSGINNVNQLLENIDKPRMDSTARNSIKGQALFLRAYYYFMLVQHWGDVPLKLKSTQTSSVQETNIARTPSRDVYSQIIADMTQAESLVPNISALGYNGRITKSAVRGLLARVCLYMAGQPVNDASKYTDAIRWARKIVDSGYHSLNPDYKQIFINQSADRYEIKETLWEVEFAGNSATSSLFTYGLGGIRVGVPQTNIDSGYVYGYLQATGLWYKAYEPTDVRRDWCIANYTYSYPGGVPARNAVASTNFYARYPAKWRREFETVLPRVKAYGPTNFPVIRYADVLLMLAEAENEVNGPANALAYVNAVRARAGASILLATDAAVSSKTSFRKTIQDERLRELNSECLRSMDLVRWGLLVANTKAAANDITTSAPTNLKFGAAAGNNITQRNVLWPIPTQEISLNRAMTQNPGY